jgi:short-subunit dehydrogenase
MPPFTDERILITGVASGLGRLLARRLVEADAVVAGLDRSRELLVELAGELPTGQFAWGVADVADRPTLLSAVAKLEQETGPFDRLIACAGIGRATPADPFSGFDFEDHIRVNLVGVANCVEAVLPGMILRKKGHLVAVSSLASFRGLPRMAGYCASKAGLNALFDSLSVELKPHGVRVTTVCPGWIRTPMTAPLTEDLRGIMEPEAAVRRILAAMAKRKRFVAFPFQSAMLVYLLRWLPPTLSDRLLRRLIQVEAK